MKKLFNKTTMKVYTVLLVVSFIGGCVLAGFTAHYKNEFEAAKAANTDLSTVITDKLSDLILSLADKNGNQNAQKAQKEEKEPEYDETTKAFLTKKNVCTAFMIVCFVLTVIFMAGAITASEYPKYLESDKYNAKLKRKEKIAKLQQKNG